MRSAHDIVRFGTVLIVIGFAAVFLGTMLMAVQNDDSGHFGGLIMIGPIPIAFGSSQEITSTMLGIGLLILVVYLLFGKWPR